MSKNAMMRIEMQLQLLSAIAACYTLQAGEPSKCDNIRDGFKLG